MDAQVGVATGDAAVLNRLRSATTGTGVSPAFPGTGDAGCLT
jgi:hypothetical protein